MRRDRGLTVSGGWDRKALVVVVVVTVVVRPAPDRSQQSARSPMLAGTSASSADWDQGSEADNRGRVRPSMVKALHHVRYADPRAVRPRSPGRVDAPFGA